MQAALDLTEIERPRIESEILQMAKTTALSKVVFKQYAAIDKELKAIHVANDYTG